MSTKVDGERDLIEERFLIPCISLRGGVGLIEDRVMTGEKHDIYCSMSTISFSDVGRFQLGTRLKTLNPQG